MLLQPRLQRPHIYIGVGRLRHDAGQGGRRVVEQIRGFKKLLLDALLDISKLDAGAFKPETRPFALQPLFESLGTAFAPVAARRW